MMKKSYNIRNMEEEDLRKLASIPVEPESEPWSEEELSVFQKVYGLEKNADYTAIQNLNKTFGTKDIELFMTWKRSKKPEDKVKVVDALMPIIAGESNKYLSSGINPTLLKLRARKLVFDALDKFNPNAGVKLSTYIRGQLRPLYRFVNQNKDTMRVPEHIGMEKKNFTDTYYNLKQMNDTEPTVKDLQHSLKWSEKKVNRFLDLLINEDVDESNFIGTSDVLKNEDTEMKTAVQTFIYSLPMKDQNIFKDIIGFTGKPLSNNQLIKKYKITINQVSNYKRKFTKDLKRFLNSHGYGN